MFDQNVLQVMGGMIMGIVVLKVIEVLVKRVMTVDYIDRKELNELLTRKEFTEFKADYAAHRASCSTCLQVIQDRQNILRESLPKDYVAKPDFRLEVSELKDWLKSIDGKVDALLITKEDLLSKGG